MASLLERLAADEAATRQRLTDLREQVTALEERLSELLIAQKVVAPLLTQRSAAEGAAQDQSDQEKPSTPPEADAEPAGPLADALLELPEVDRRVVLAMASAGRPLRAREVAQALGEPDIRGRVETTRARLKRLVTAGWLAETEPGLFSIVTEVNGHTMKGAADTDKG
ncbi:hypothetical protein [Streptosporangium canum]|uniref:hypothetical protein n=1 Tax=Streptosporangium canum TaxID=324952 RepID=UPI001160666F|nr:hypothetical protein [Streptosporangium canum]